jgi:hypothetical protein
MAFHLLDLKDRIENLYTQLDIIDSRLEQLKTYQQNVCGKEEDWNEVGNEWERLFHRSKALVRKIEEIM